MSRDSWWPKKTILRQRKTRKHFHDVQPYTPLRHGQPTRTTSIGIEMPGLNMELESGVDKGSRQRLIHKVKLLQSSIQRFWQSTKELAAIASKEI
jgi:hypothetical protein